jgi:hypothetical protein
MTCARAMTAPLRSVTLPLTVEVEAPQASAGAAIISQALMSNGSRRLRVAARFRIAGFVHRVY